MRKKRRKEKREREREKERDKRKISMKKYIKLTFIKTLALSTYYKKKAAHDKKKKRKKFFCHLQWYTKLLFHIRVSLSS